MTNNPDKVWPKGIVPYLIHRRLSEYMQEFFKILYVCDTPTV